MKRGKRQRKGKRSVEREGGRRKQEQAQKH